MKGNGEKPQTTSPKENEMTTSTHTANDDLKTINAALSEALRLITEWDDEPTPRSQETLWDDSISPCLDVLDRVSSLEASEIISLSLKFSSVFGAAERGFQHTEESLSHLRSRLIHTTDGFSAALNREFGLAGLKAILIRQLNSEFRKAVTG